MIWEGGILRSLRAAGAGVVLFSLCACMGGTGTDTENGVSISARVVDSSEKPVANIELEVLDLSASADTKGSPLVDPSTPLKSRNDGFVDIELKKTGLYIAQGRRGDSVVFADTLRVIRIPDKGSTSKGGFGTPQFVVESPIKATGHVKLLSGFKADSGRVLIQGTKLESRLAADGSYVLGWLPLSMEKLTLNAAYGARQANKRFVKVVQQGANWQVLMTSNRCLADSTTGTLLPANSGPGSLRNPAVIARVAALSCKGSTGSQVRVLRTNASGVVDSVLGDFVIPDAAALIPDSSAAVPVGCIRTGTSGSSRASLMLNAGQIVVDDIIRGGNCPAP